MLRRLIWIKRRSYYGDSLRKYNKPLDRELWEDLYRYRKELLSSSDDTLKGRGKEIHKQMSQITIEAKKAAGIAKPNDDEESDS